MVKNLFFISTLCIFICLFINPLAARVIPDLQFIDSSVDGETVLFITLKEGKLYVIGQNNTPIKLSEHVKSAKLSKDGTKVAFIKSDPGLWIIGSDGSGEKQLIEGKILSYDWLPDGLRILATVFSEEIGAKIVKVNIETGKNNTLFIQSPIELAEPLVVPNTVLSTNQIEKQKINTVQPQEKPEEKLPPRPESEKAIKEAPVRPID